MEENFKPPTGPGPKSWCARHWQPFREGKPGGIVMSVKLMQAAWFHPRIKELMGEIPEEEEPAKTDHMNLAFSKAGPLCCMLGDAHLEKLHAWLEQVSCRVDYLRQDCDQPLRCHKPAGHDGEHEHFWPPYEVPEAPETGMDWERKH